MWFIILFDAALVRPVLGSPPTALQRKKSKKEMFAFVNRMARPKKDAGAGAFSRKGYPIEQYTFDYLSINEPYMCYGPPRNC